MSEDAYVRYTRTFFRKWAKVYDLFGIGVVPVYRATARLASSQGGRVLDVATGTGAVATRCTSSAGEVMGVDISPAMLARAVRKTRHSASPQFLLGDVRRLPFADDRFDVAVISFALHDMPRKVRRSVLREASRVAPRLVVADYDMDLSSRWGRLGVASMNLVESPYFKGFVSIGPEATLREEGFEPHLRHRWLGFASVWEALRPNR